MSKLNREDIKALLVLVIGIALVIVAIRFFIILLPFIVLGLVALLLYDSYKNKRFFWQEKKGKNNAVKEAEIIKEKKNN